MYPELGIITEWDDDIKCPGARGFHPNIDNSKTVRELQINFQGLEEMVKTCDPWIKALLKKQ